MRTILIGVLAAMLMLAPGGGAVAQDETADILRAHLYDGRLAEGRAAMEALAGDDATAAFGVGLTTLLEGIEGLAQALYAHGFNPERGIAVSPFFGIEAMADGTREPEPLTYVLLRGYLEAFSADMDAALPLLVAASEGEFAVEIDVEKIRVDIDGDGVAADAESVGPSSPWRPARGGGWTWAWAWRPRWFCRPASSPSTGRTRCGWRDIRR